MVGPKHEYSAAAAADDNDTAAEEAHVLSSSVLGELRPVRLPGDDASSSWFSPAVRVPTYAAAAANEDSSSSSSVTLLDHHRQSHRRRRRGAQSIQGVIQQSPAFVLDHVLSSEACEDLIRVCEVLHGDYRAGKNHHGALQLIVSQQVCDEIAATLAPFINLQDVLDNMMQQNSSSSSMQQPQDEEYDIRLTLAGLNRRWRMYRYAPEGNETFETFAPHIDAAFPPSGLGGDDGTTLVWDASDNSTTNECNTTSTTTMMSHLTVLMYLNDDFCGGETKFYQPLGLEESSRKKESTTTTAFNVVAAVRPKAGSILVFPQAIGEEAVEHARRHWCLHEGAPVTSGRRPKFVIRSDVVFAMTKQRLPVEDPLARHDHLVQSAFLPKANDHHDSVFSSNFLQHVAPLYNPHMGVENLGPFLYSFLRFTKQRRIVEIGAGYTSLWILQALKDNDEEMQRIWALEQQGSCRLLDYPWTVDGVCDKFLQRDDDDDDDDGEKTAASLLCVDNCLHQKETATGAAAVAKALGLDSYMTFVRADAFALTLEPESVDVLWCDFGVGSRMKEFVRTAWTCIRPGGFLLCHSTLTNSRTREWLEAARARKGRDDTGMPPDEYVELSLLEPHKRYQNSISIFQKRKGKDKKDYTEPLYSEYA